MTEWHIAHMGGIAQRGPGFLMFEGTAILPEGRISPQDVGLWQDSQIEPMRRVVEFIHSQGLCLLSTLGDGLIRIKALVPSPTTIVHLSLTP